MNTTFDEYKIEFLKEIHELAQLKGILPADAFLQESLDKLSDMGELVDPEITSFEKKCRQNKTMSFDAYAFDGSDKSLVLISSDYKESCDEIITKTELESIKNKMINFLQEAYDNKLYLYCDTSSELIQIGSSIATRIKKDYIDEANDSIDKIKLYILTDRSLSERIKTLNCDDFQGKQVEVNVWSINRFYDLYASGREREAIIIDTKKYGLSGIPCIKAQMSGNLDYDAYLAIVPGDFLHKIYNKHGSRLLEGNVRSFLSVRGKINKGIRQTIKNDPTKFFTYNNGIACTAKSIKLSDDGKEIIELEDLQIINGGQTTASLTSAVIKDKASLDNIFVPMKLTVVKDSNYDDMIANISKYANSQNKVSDSDLFSNHPFHREFEKLSNTVQAPIVGNGINNTYWYYERTKGKYEQDLFKKQTKVEKDEFIRKYPKKQVIKKEALAKYYTTAELLSPTMVALGNQKCMSAFGAYIDKQYENHEVNINEEFFKKCICYAILFRTTDTLIQSAEWYEKNSDKQDIAAYTISKLIGLIPSDKSLDYDLIWKKQDIYPSLKYELLKMAKYTFDFIKSKSGLINMNFRNEAIWKEYKSIPYSFCKQFIEDLVSKELIFEKNRSAAKEKKEQLNLNIERQIVEFGSEYWEDLIAEGEKRRLLTSGEKSLLSIAANIEYTGKVPTSVQAKLIWKIRTKLDDNGVLVDRPN